MLSQSQQIYELMKACVAEAGNVLMQHRGKVEDEGKDDKENLGDEYAAEGMAKTVVDEIVQELFLASLHRIHPDVRINVEEETPLKYLFRGNKSEICVHQDPCDGTLGYINGRDDFAAGYAISDRQNDFTHTVIFAPARDRIYLASPEECMVLDGDMKELQYKIGKNQTRIFEKRMLSETGREKMREEGFTIEKIGSALVPISEVALGDAAAYLYGCQKAHDSFIPYAFARQCAAQLLDADGNPISGKNLTVKETGGFPNFGRSPSICYFSFANERVDTILRILADERNLHPEYLARR